MTEQPKPSLTQAAFGITLLVFVQVIIAPLAALLFGYIVGNLVLTLFTNTVTTTLYQLGIGVSLPIITSAIALAGYLFNPLQLPSE